MVKRRFTVKSFESDSTEFSLALDLSGNACLSADGIEIFYVDAGDGAGYTMMLDEVEQKRLSALSFRYSRLAMK